MKAKSMFEGKASEAAKDKTSGGFRTKDVMRKVSKNAALFEARSRGEHVAISSRHDAVEATSSRRKIPTVDLKGNELTHSKSFSQTEKMEHVASKIPETPFSTRHLRRESPAKSGVSMKKCVFPSPMKTSEDLKSLEFQVEAMPGESNSPIDNDFNESGSGIKPELIANTSVLKGYDGPKETSPRMVHGVTASRIPRSTSPLMKPHGTSKSRMEAVDTLIREVDRQGFEERPKRTTVFVGRKSPSPTPNLKLSNDKNVFNADAKFKDISRRDRVKLKSRSPTTKQKTDVSKEFYESPGPSAEVDSANVNFDIKEGEWALSTAKLQSKSLVEGSKSTFNASSVDELIERNLDEGIQEVEEVAKSQTMEATPSNARITNVVSSSKVSTKSAQKKLKETVISVSTENDYIVGHAAIDPPSKGYQRMTNNFDLITSCYGTGPVDENGKPLFGLRALRKPKDLQNNGNSESIFDSNGNEINKLGSFQESELTRKIPRPINTFGIEVIRRKSVDSSGTSTSSSIDGLNVIGEYVVDVRMTPKSILKKNPLFLSMSSEPKLELSSAGVGQVVKTSSSASIVNTNSNMESEFQLMSSTSLPQLVEGPSTESVYGSAQKNWQYSSVDQIIGSALVPGDSNIPTPGDSTLLSRGRVGGSSVRDIAKKFESAIKTRKVEEVKITTSSSIQSMTTLVPTGQLSSDSHQRTGRNFFNDQSPVSGISDVLDRMRWVPEGATDTDDNNAGIELLNKFIGAQVLMQGIEPLLTSNQVSSNDTMSRSLVLNEIDEELDAAKLRSMLNDCKEDEIRQRIETRLQTIGGVGGSIKVAKTATRSSDVTGELMPFILGQLQTSLESFSGSGGGPMGSSHVVRRESSGNHVSMSSPQSSSSHLSQSTSANGQSRNGSPPKAQDPMTSPTEEFPSVGGAEECLFDSGTESGEDAASSDPPLRTSKKDSPPAEFSSFMEGLRHSLTREGLGLISSLGGTETLSRTKESIGGKVLNPSGLSVGVNVPESDLIQQVEKVLSQLRDSLLKDPNCLNQTLKTDGKKSGTELIALIDRLKSSLQTPSESKSCTLPLVVGSQSPSPPKEPQPPDLIPLRKLPWAVTDGGEGPWKIRAAKKRSQVRSRSVGVSDEELEEARRHMQEEAFRSALREESKSKNSGIEAKNWKEENGNVSKCDPVTSFLRTRDIRHEPKRLCSLDDSIVLSHIEHLKLKPFRTFSLDNTQSEIGDLDPSRSFFTPEEVVQIAIHKAAIKKQVSDEENRRRRSSLKTSTFLPKQGPIQVPRDFTLGLPKPYVPPSLSSSDDQVGPRGQSGAMILFNKNGKLNTTTTSHSETPTSPLQSPTKRSIENVQISLKDSGDFPQLQIAITLNTNSNQESSIKKRGFESEETETGQGQGSSDESIKATRYRNKNERKKKMKRANTIDVRPAPDIDLNDESEESEEETFSQPQSINSLQTLGDQKFSSFLEKVKQTEPSPKPAFLNVNDKYWNNRFSNLKTSFESSSQGSSPSISPIPSNIHLRGPQHIHAHTPVLFKPTQHQHFQSPTKPIWATGATSPDGHLPLPSSSVRKKLSVFESRVDPLPHHVTGKIGEHWNPSNNVNSQGISFTPPTKSSILQKRETFEKKLINERQEEQGGIGSLRKPMGILTKQFEQHQFPQITPRPQPPLIYEGVHSVHATKSAMEAMLRQQNQPQPPPPLPSRINQAQGIERPNPSPSLGHRDNEKESIWEKVIQQPTSPKALHLPKSPPIFQIKNNQISTPPPPILPTSRSMPFKKIEFENINPPPSIVRQRTSVFENQDSSNSRGPKLNAFGVTKTFEDTVTVQPKNETNNETDVSDSLFLRSISSLPTRQESFPEKVEDGEREAGTLNLPVVSKVMRGPQQQRATFSSREMSSLGTDHPSAQRIRHTQPPIPRSLLQPIPISETHPPKGPPFPPRNLHLPPLAKSHSGDALGFNGGMSKKFPTQVHHPPSLLSLSIPRQKSLSAFPPPDSSSSSSQYPFQSQPFKNMGFSQNVSMSNPSLPITSKTVPSISMSPHDSLQRTSSGSSIFERAKSLYISSQDTHGGGPPKAPLPQRKKPPTLPRTNTLFPKQYEAQMSPESADKKQREVEAYFKFQQSQVESSRPPPPSCPARYTKGKKDEGYENRIRKSASQGKIMNRQKSYSDGDDDDDNVDQIFESLFKASVESKLAKTTVSGDTSSSELSQLKANKSAVQSKTLEASASVQESKTPTGSTTVVVQKQSSLSKSSYSTSSTATSEKVTTTSTSVTPFAKFKELDHQNSALKSSDQGTIMVTNQPFKSSSSSIKEALLVWCQGRTREYKNVNIENFSSSWANGLGFCALIHHFYKDSFDYDSLSPENPLHNFKLAFRIADEKAGIYPLLEAEDMMVMGNRPDWKCVFTYVQSMYQKLKNV